MRNFGPHSFFLAVALAASCLQAVAQMPDTKPPEENPPVLDSRDRIYYPGDTESVKPLAKKLFGNLLLDQKQIWTSPFHMHKSDAKWWILFGTATAVLIATDHRSSMIFENSKGQVAWANHLSNIGSTYTLIPIAAGFYAFGVLRDDPKAREVGVLGAEAMLDTLIVVEVLKPIAGRNRPNAQNEPGHFFEGGNGFPSGHAIASWALASVIAHEYSKSKLVPIIAYGLAAVVSGSRFAARQHYASDILVGAGMGWFIGRFVYQTHVDHAGHQHAWLHPRIQPQFDPGSRTYAAGLVFSR
jgi:membrane-associated phospholipid phosphatase